MDYTFQPEVIQKVEGIFLSVTFSKQSITFQHSQEWKCSAENVSMLVSYECERGNDTVLLERFKITSEMALSKPRIFQSHAVLNTSYLPCY